MRNRTALPKPSAEDGDVYVKICDEPEELASPIVAHEYCHAKLPRLLHSDLARSPRLDHRVCARYAHAFHYSRPRETPPTLGQRAVHRGSIFGRLKMIIGHCENADLCCREPS